MRTTIDAAGRVVIPKALRDELGLTGRQELEVTARDGRLELEVPATPVRLQRRGRRLVAVADREMPTLTAETVRDVLEHVRR